MENIVTLTFEEKQKVAKESLEETAARVIIEKLGCEMQGPYLDAVSQALVMRAKEFLDMNINMLLELAITDVCEED